MDGERVTTTEAMGWLLRAALDAEEGGISLNVGTAVLHLPTAVLEEIGKEGEEGPTCHFMDGNVREENDVGWMYRNISDPVGQHEKGEEVFGMEEEHLIWPTDSF